MTKRILIDPVSRIEGHAKITIHLDDKDQVDFARFLDTEWDWYARQMSAAGVLPQP